MESLCHKEISTSQAADGQTYEYCSQAWCWKTWVGHISLQNVLLALPAQAKYSDSKYNDYNVTYYKWNMTTNLKIWEVANNHKSTYCPHLEKSSYDPTA